MKKFNIVMLGAPGSGKGTQAKIMAQKFNLAHVSTGDLFRKNIANMLHDCLEQMPEIIGSILDGVPRTIQQAEMLDGIGHDKNLPISLVINLNVDEEEIIKRMLNRARLEGRSDDTPEIIEKRIANYFAQTKPLEDYYAAKGLLRHINGMDTVENISEEICRIIAEEMEK